MSNAGQAAIGPGAQVLWLQPISASEAAFARGKGVEALERLFEREGVNYLARDRKAVV